jgi:4-hydroxythreonine-4-phosphate dehydrogenase
MGCEIAQSSCYKHAPRRLMSERLMPKRILITPGEPAGVGPDITIQIAQQHFDAELVVIADTDLLKARAEQLKLPLTLIPFDKNNHPEINPPGTLKIIPVTLGAPCKTGQLNRDNANYVIQCLTLAADYCQQQIADAVVTGPVHKGIINDANISFRGHTEFFAERCHVKQPIMLFVTPKTNVALLTTHLALADVPRAITAEKIKSILRILQIELCNKFRLTNPRILVCGLNPHAGEKGHLGREEIDIIEPALNDLRLEKLNVIGPLPADTIFTEKYLAEADAILAMYHDQALPVVKYMGFGHAVNVTLGLPFIRTSVDHGTALDVAGTDKVDAGSLVAALKLAIQLTVSH